MLNCDVATNIFLLSNNWLYKFLKLHAKTSLSIDGLCIIKNVPVSSNLDQVADCLLLIVATVRGKLAVRAISE